MYSFFLYYRKKVGDFFSEKSEFVCAGLGEDCLDQTGVRPYCGVVSMNRFRESPWQRG